MHKNADTVIVLDFETTGLSPTQGNRAIEIGAVLLENGIVIATFQKLMYPGFRINSFIENYTGITNQMLKRAATCEEVMAEFAQFIGDHNLVAHNASFDKRFLDNEFSLINHDYPGNFACSMLIARRMYHRAPDHKLGTLVRYHRIKNDGVFHRALDDATLTSKLWLKMIEDVKLDYSTEQITFLQMQEIAKKKIRA